MWHDMNDTVGILHQNHYGYHSANSHVCVQNTWLRCLTEAQDAYQRTNQPTTTEAPRTPSGPCPCCMPISPNEKKTHCDPERCGCCCCRRTRRKSLNQLMPPPPFFQFEQPKDTSRQPAATLDVPLPEEEQVTLIALPENDLTTSQWYLYVTAASWTDPAGDGKYRNDANVSEGRRLKLTVLTVEFTCSKQEHSACLRTGTQSEPDPDLNLNFGALLWFVRSSLASLPLGPMRYLQAPDRATLLYYWGLVARRSLKS